MDLMERRGSGLRKIIEAYKMEENYKNDLEPEFKSTESSFITILKNLNYNTKSDGQNDGQSDGQNDGQNVGENVGQNVGKKLKPADRRKQILKIISLNPKNTAKSLSEKFGVSVSTIERDLKYLTEANLIKYVGSAKDGYWKIINEDIK